VIQSTATLASNSKFLNLLVTKAFIRICAGTVSELLTEIKYGKKKSAHRLSKIQE
jgi:uncharacterized Fe-S radical SAM superfamily protein PflX